MNKMKTHFAMFLAVMTMLIGARVLQAEELRVAVYNVENMFDVFDDPYMEDEGTDVKSREEIVQLAKAIRFLDADVVGFAEVENEHVLRAMVQEFLPDMGYDYIACPMTNSGRGISLGLISRKPIVKATSYRWQTFTLPGAKRTWKFARDLTHITVQATKEKVMDVFVVHFKSKRDSAGDKQSANWRLAEATQARKIINQIYDNDPDAWVVMTGDLNDTPESPVLKTLTQDGGLVDMHTHLPEEQRITYLNLPHRSRIDYILASPALAKKADKDSAVIVHDKEIIAGSDHAPLAVTFDLD
ncbi:endonuclease/exonuclease/phosphatase family protein [Poriferisphaera sp. WC338]|uniref:endonuclease/exonuclease/phosphatase family protein n=1 Tax=Poriferisphaera sp. WC338 TaxID=3425129 RepID=UPI003D812BE5